MARRFWVYRRATAICLRSKPGTWHGTSRLESVPGWWLTYPSEKSWLYNVIYHIWQVVLTILKNMKVSWDDEIPNIWKNKSHVPNHQPGSGAGSSCYIFWCKDPPMAQNAQSTVHKKMLTFQISVVEKWLNWTRKVQPNKTILQKQENMPYYERPERPSASSMTSRWKNDVQTNRCQSSVLTSPNLSYRRLNVCIPLSSAAQTPQSWPAHLGSYPHVLSFYMVLC